MVTGVKYFVSSRGRRGEGRTPEVYLGVISPRLCPGKSDRFDDLE